MKKYSKYLVAIILIAMLVCIHHENVWAAGGSLNGPGTVRAGDNISVTLNLSAPGSFGMEGTLAYDASVLTLTGVKCNVSGWKLETNGNKLVCYDDALANPLGNSQNVITATFKVNNVAQGTAVSVSVNGVVATNGNAESNLGNISYNTSVAAPLSGNTNLSSLSISNATLSPAFSATNTSYNAGEVEFAVSSLDIKAVAEDGKSTVSIGGNNLSVGNNTVSVVVKAESGATKTYTIAVNRKQDPNYVASSNGDLSSLTVSTGTLSPAFAADVTEYVVYVPYEVKSISATGVAADPKAAGVTDGKIDALAAGSNTMSVIAKAEDGSEKKYNITVVVMPEYNGTVPKIEGAEAKPEETTTVAEETTTAEEETVVTESNDESKGNGINVVLIIIFMIVGAGMGFGGCYVWCRKRGIRFR